MDFAEDDLSQSKRVKKSSRKRYSGTKVASEQNKALVKIGEEFLESLQDKSEDSRNFSPLEEVVSDVVNSVSQGERKKFVNIRCRSGSSDVCSDGTSNFVEENKSDAGKQSTNLSSQSTLCSGITRKLKVKSNRGRPRKVTSKHRNPFEIGGGFKRRYKSRVKGKISQKYRRSSLTTQYLQIVPSTVVGSSVKQALEILETAENMGLAVRGDREVVVKEIARQLEKNEL
ncbi:hypothetical protein DCAR_0624147 [Daucus carota subsp. sativus]|uniref:Uncharacterized protein n=1 Tax=Daucus carota subsp. sativus TaxID=79200 RepID=A0A161ZS82_DAUCS|nr:hypothetical protein DCAR_0624147 [Daucus carota subsp. sativus]